MSSFSAHNQLHRTKRSGRRKCTGNANSSLLTSSSQLFNMETGDQVQMGDLRRNLLMRRQHNDLLQVRKQRKEERLQARRAAGGDFDASLQSSLNNDATHLKTALESVLANDNIHNIYALLNNVQQIISKCSEVITSYTLERLVIEEPEKAKALITVLSKTLVQQKQTSPGNHEIFPVIHHILLAITSSSPQVRGKYNQFSAKTQDDEEQDDNYYGMVPLQWSDLILDETPLISELLSSAEIPVVANVLGNVVQEGGTNAISQIWPIWNRIVSLLPSTSYLCAAMAQKDNTSLASTFMQDLSTKVLTSLLLQQEQLEKQTGATTTETSSVTTIIVDLAWILEGLSRREDEAVTMMCEDENFMRTLASRVADHTLKQNSPFLFPVLKAIGNMAVACDGIFVPLLLSYFRQTLSNILEEGILVEGVKTAACFLFDAGIPQHPSTQTALSSFAPSLLRMIATGTHEWKREAIVALQLAITIPPLNPGRPISAQDETMNNPIFLIWNAIADPEKNIFLLALLDMSCLPDIVASVCAIRVLDAFLRTIPSSASALSDEHHRTVVDSLHSVLAVGSNNPEHKAVHDRAEIALDLLDDFFENEEDEEDEGEIENPVAPEVAANGTFQFGALPSVQQQPQQNHQLAFDRPPPPAGRGRGRVIPSWMAQQQQRQQQPSL